MDIEKERETELIGPKGTRGKVNSFYLEFCSGILEYYKSNLLICCLFLNLVFIQYVSNLTSTIITKNSTRKQERKKKRSRLALIAVTCNQMFVDFGMLYFFYKLTFTSNSWDQESTHKLKQITSVTVHRIPQKTNWLNQQIMSQKNICINRGNI